MKRHTPDHPKTRALARALGVRCYAAVGLLELLRHYAARFAPQGDVGRFDDTALADALDYEGDPTALVAALVTTGWLDACATHRLLVHDWENHADQGVKNALKSRGLPFLRGSDPGRTPVGPQSDPGRTPVGPQSDPGRTGVHPEAVSPPVERSEDALRRVPQRNATDDALRSPSMAAFRRSSLVERSEDALKGRPPRSGTDTEGPPALSPLTDASSVAIEAATATSRPTPAEQARGLLALVNSTGGTHFQPVEANLRLIRARLTEYGDWTLAAMVRRQWATWKAQPDMRPFFRPATLFNAEKCAQYVGQLTDTDRAWIQRKQAEGAAA